MKKILLILSISVLCSCGTKELSPDPLIERNGDQLVEREGIFYEISSQTPFTGTVVEFHDNGQLKEQGFFKDGKLYGPWEFYYKNGQLKQKGSFVDGKPDEQYESYESYYESGQLSFKGSYKHGKQDGLWESYHENGKLNSQGSYVDDIRVGKWSWYDVDGLILREESF